MTNKEGVLRSLAELNRPVNNVEVCQHIVANNYCDYSSAKTPASTISAVLGDFVRNNDSRVGRQKKSDGSFLYFLTENELNNGVDPNQTVQEDLNNSENESNAVPRQQALAQLPSPVNNYSAPKVEKQKPYGERDLHKLLSTHLKQTDTFSKTIFHEQSNGKDPNQIWTHPDMVGISFLKLQSKASQSLLKSVSKVDTFKLSSYELKREINTDSELKQAFFQAVSNSSWANFGYVVAFDFRESLRDEMTRLNQSFGIGIIQLNTNPEENKILFPATFRELDFKTIDKLCIMNKPFERFMEQVEKWLMADDKYLKGAEKELGEFCDAYFEDETEVKEYCRQKNIPLKD